MTFWDGFLPALGVFAAAGVAYVTWRFWKWIIPGAVLLCLAVGGYIVWHDHQISQAGKGGGPVATQSPLTFDDLIPKKQEVGCDNPFGRFDPGGDEWLERCKDDPAYIEMEKARVIKEAKARAEAAAKAEQDSKAAAGR
ncbi:hypothetical protein ELI00_05295 [Rhizobium ruizarguesonis]|uniref:hypothetical protein n=1 Tax=Rhizobium ruizarguesonis TaxID=2081791 RepID=UPI001031779F|nr:hypothetical protein [Rhizobium ruizarguesonis]TAX75707.1 hypothetical protein ELI00_05295 [Rhizobium ruizarguesonis]